MRSLCRLPVVKNHNFGKILTFGALVPTPFTDQGQIWCTIADPRCTCQISFPSVYCRPLAAKAPNFAVFGLRRLVTVMSPIGISLRKLSTGAQLQTFHYQTASKSLLYSNAFVAKSGAQSLTFKSVTDRQTNRQTNRQTYKKLNVFDRPGGG